MDHWAAFQKYLHWLRRGTRFIGIFSSYNSAARLFNEALLHSNQKLRIELKDAHATVVHVDIYAIKYDLITNEASMVTQASEATTFFSFKYR